MLPPSRGSCVHLLCALLRGFVQVGFAGEMKREHDEGVYSFWVVHNRTAVARLCFVAFAFYSSWFGAEGRAPRHPLNAFVFLSFGGARFWSVAWLLQVSLRSACLCHHLIH